MATTTATANTNGVGVTTASTKIGAGTDGGVLSDPTAAILANGIDRAALATVVGGLPSALP